MNIILKTSVRKKRFDSKGKLLRNDDSSEIEDKNISEVCSLLDFPLKKILKLVRNFQEAKALTNCLVYSNHLKILWPTILLSFVSYQIHLRYIKTENAKMKAFLLFQENKCIYSCISN